MLANSQQTHPYSRLLIAAVGLVGVILISDYKILLLTYLLGVLPLLYINGSIKKHFGLLLFGIVPITFSFILIYILLLDGKSGGWEFLWIRITKLLLLTSVFQFTLSIPADALLSTMRKWGLKGETLLIALGSFVVWEDIKSRADKIITARFSRGIIGKRTILNKAKQFPFVLIPLIIGVMRTATERSDSWQQKNIMNLIDSHTVVTHYSLLPSLIIFIVSGVWAFYSIVTIIL